MYTAHTESTLITISTESYDDNEIGNNKIISSTDNHTILLFFIRTTFILFSLVEALPRIFITFD